MFAIDLEGPFLLFSLLREMGIELRMELQNFATKSSCCLYATSIIVHETRVGKDGIEPAE
jgi:hypothetical protein